MHINLYIVHTLFKFKKINKSKQNTTNFFVKKIKLNKNQSVREHSLRSLTRELFVLIRTMKSKMQ